MRYAIFHIQLLRPTKTAGKLARSVAVGMCQKKDKPPAWGDCTCIFLYLHILEISYVSLRIDK